MKKVIEANIDEGILDFVTGISSGKTAKNFPRRKIVQDILFYQRKCLALLRRLQMLPESVEDEEIKNMCSEIEDLRKSIELEAAKI